MRKSEPVLGWQRQVVHSWCCEPANQTDHNDLKRHIFTDKKENYVIMILFIDSEEGSLFVPIRYALDDTECNIKRSGSG